MKVAGILPFKHLKYINECLILIALRISSVTLLYKLQNATEKVVFWINASSQKITERLVLWYEFEFDSHGKLSHVKLLIKEKCPNTIITERYRFCCFNMHSNFNHNELKKKTLGPYTCIYNASNKGAEHWKS